MPTRKWGTEKLVNTTTSGNQTWARVAELAGGGYVVVWEDDGLAFSAIRAQVFDTAGNRVGSEIAVIVQPGGVMQRGEPARGRGVSVHVSPLRHRHLRFALLVVALMIALADR